MEDEAYPERQDRRWPANDNRRPERVKDEDADIAPWQRVDRVTLNIARLIGRQIAREHFEALQTAQANDNARRVPETENRKTPRKTEQD